VKKIGPFELWDEREMNDLKDANLMPRDNAK
jgi:hypothetical protein